METRKLVWSLILAGVVVTAACGDSASSLNPTAPSALSAPALSAGSGAVAEPAATGRGGNTNGNGSGNNGNGSNGNGNNGNGNNNGGGNGQQPNTPGNTSPSAPGQAKVEIEGVITDVDGDSIEVNGQTVLVTADTVIRHGNQSFQLSDLRKGDRVHVRATRLESGGGTTATASLQATEILLQTRGKASEEPSTSAPTNLVSVAATDPFASERPTATGPDTGTFRLTRTGDPTLLAASLSVTFTLTGTAVNGTDYVTLPLTATFAAGSPTVDVIVTPIADTLSEGSETAVLTLTNVSPYALGSPVSATVEITLPQVSVTAVDASASESGDTGTFRVTRTGDVSTRLLVSVKYSGTAAKGVDYVSLLSTVIFEAGQSAVDVVVTPIADSITDPSETVTLTVLDGAVYDIGPFPSATVTITGS